MALQADRGEKGQFLALFLSIKSSPIKRFSEMLVFCGLSCYTTRVAV
jgi:hypothetical protein